MGFYARFVLFGVVNCVPADFLALPRSIYNCEMGSFLHFTIKLYQFCGGLFRWTSASDRTVTVYANKIQIQIQTQTQAHAIFQPD